jgi:predicted  nucleic acid-binding Zn-ribbon protein
MRQLLTIALVAITAASCVSKEKYDDLEYENQKLQNRIDELESLNYDLEYEVSDLEYRLEEAEDQLEEAEDIIDEAKRTCLLWTEDSYMVLNVLNRYWW